MLRLALTLLLSTPAQAAHIVDEPALVSICWRESRCRVVGVHRIDRWLSRTAYRKARQRGLLDPTCHHHGPDHVWSTSGPFGMIRAYALPYLGMCLPPWVLDIPIVAAWVAKQRYAVAHRRDAPPALKRWAMLI